MDHNQLTVPSLPAPALILFGVQTSSASCTSSGTEPWRSRERRWASLRGSPLESPPRRQADRASGLQAEGFRGYETQGIAVGQFSGEPSTQAHAVSNGGPLPRVVRSGTPGELERHCHALLLTLCCPCPCLPPDDAQHLPHGGPWRGQRDAGNSAPARNPDGEGGVKRGSCTCCVHVCVL